MLFKPHLPLLLRWLQVLSPSIYIFANSVAELNLEPIYFLTIISCNCYLSQDLHSIMILIISHWIHLPLVNRKWSKVLLLIWIIDLMKYFLLLIHITRNFLLVLGLLKISLVNSLFIPLTSVVKIISYLNCTNLMIYWLYPCQILLTLLLLLILVSKTMSPLLSLTFMSMTNLLSKLYSMVWMSWPQKLNFLLLDVVSIRPSVFLAFLKLLSLYIHSMPLKEFLILHYIYSKYTLCPFQMSSEDSSSKTSIIQLNFENAQVIAIGHFIKLLIKNLNSSIPYLIILASLLGTSAKLKTIDLVSILFYFILFSLIFYWGVEDEEDKVWHYHRLYDMVTECSCDTREQDRRFWKDEIITLCGTHVGLKKNTWSLG